ncbi:MAG: hypothetical protein K0041_05170 [Acidithiobacillus sp.]|nr:hypothetical protein [Acidithiobacillus sp.]
MGMLDIDWSKVHEKYKWAAQDEDGKTFVFESKPFLFEGELGVWDSFGYMVLIENNGEPNPDWKNTLTKRPEK